MLFSALANRRIPTTLWSIFSPMTVLSVSIRKYSTDLTDRHNVNIMAHRLSGLHFMFFYIPPFFSFCPLFLSGGCLYGQSPFHHIGSGKTKTFAAAIDKYPL
jgi:hypothetical protein